MKDKTEDVIHSSAYANAQNADRMGTTDSMSFSQRMAIEGNRKIVRSYRDSKIVNETSTGKSKATQYSASEDRFLNKSNDSANVQRATLPTGEGVAQGQSSGWHGAVSRQEAAIRRGTPLKPISIPKRGFGPK
ncbi:hypothetical protein IKF04_00710 [Candidatus Saccharibacteria bacterium]|nr:hypothetical protein [Candidatus Saccharibacteria bacterium]